MQENERTVQWRVQGKGERGVREKRPLGKPDMGLSSGTAVDKD